MANDIVDTKAEKPYDRWNAEITAAEKELKKFHERGRLVVKKLLDERAAENSAAKWFNVYKANVDILEAALYAQPPKPAVTRSFKDYEDEPARVAALILQRAITPDADDPMDSFDSTMRHCVQDRLVAGLSMAWLRLETDTEEIEGVELDDILPSPQPGMETEELGPEDAPQRIIDQRVVVDYIYWEDFLWSPCRVYEERRWVGRRVYMTRDELVERFGAKGRLASLDYNPKRYETNSVTPKWDEQKKGVVYEIWDRSERKVIWLNKGMTDLLDERDDPLGLEGFEPCPRPMLANISTSNTTPRPDYYMIQDQYQELDTINNRISMLVQACKVVGVYDRSAIGVQRMLQEGSDNTLIPVDNWAVFAEKNGLRGQIDWMPLEAVVQTLEQLNRAREIIKAQIYELTGISDIVRGASKASETLGAQEIKAQFAGVRIKKLQDEVARFVSDVSRLKAEIMVKHFSPEMLVEKSNIALTGNDEWVPQALSLLASDVGFNWRIKVTAESLAQADYAFEKADRNEFLLAVSNFMEKALPMVAQFPDSMVLMTSMLKWGIAGYRNSAEIEGMIDKELDAMVKAAKQPKEPPPPSPEEVKAKAEAEKMQQQAQIDQQKAQQDFQIKQAEAQMAQQRAMAAQQADEQRLMLELQAEKQRLALEQQQQQMDLRFEQLMQMLKLQGARDMQELKLDAAQEQARIKANAAQETTNGSE